MSCCDGQLVGGSIPVPGPGAGEVIGASFATDFLAPSLPGELSTVLTVDPRALNAGAEYFFDGSQDNVGWTVLAHIVTGNPGRVPIPGVWAFMRVRRRDPGSGTPNMGLVGQEACDCAVGPEAGCPVLNFSQREPLFNGHEFGDGVQLLAEWQPGLDAILGGLASQMGVYLSGLASSFSDLDPLSRIAIVVGSSAPGVIDGTIVAQDTVASPSTDAPFNISGNIATAGLDGTTLVQVVATGPCSLRGFVASMTCPVNS